MRNNVFDEPNFYLNELKNISFIKRDKQKRHTGKSVAVIFLTRYCNLGCDFCIYKSKPKNEIEVNEKNEFSNIGCERAISFINDSNVGYLLIAGGGEPFEKEQCIYDIMRQVNVERVIIATNGFWVLDSKKTKEIFEKLNEILSKQKYIKDFIIRFSIDQWHQKKINLQSVAEMFKLYSNIVDDKDRFKLEIHTIIGDNTISELVKEMGKEVYENDSITYVSDNKKIYKKSKKRSYIEMRDNQRINVGYAKLFYPNLKINLNQPKEKTEKVLKPFYEDVINSQDGNFSTVQNNDGTFGLDYLINFNGNVSTWGNYQLKNIPNLYSNSNEEINNLLYNDLISYSYIDLDLADREKIVKKVNPLAVTRSAAINVRDYSGAYLLYENKTALYYLIMIIKKYIDEGLIDTETIEQLPEELYNLINTDESLIQQEYNKSNYSIINQYIENEENKMENWAAILYLIKNGHFFVPEQQMRLALNYINSKQTDKFNDIDEIIQKYDAKIYSTIIEQMTTIPENNKAYKL